jgi:7-keto-8-aminopelargonate synthetase-like enzyme
MESKFIEKIIEIVGNFKKQGKAYLTTLPQSFNGDYYPLAMGNFKNFSLCDYLNLSNDERIKRAAADASMKYGVYTAMSRTFMKLSIYEEAEQIVSEIFGFPVLLLPRTTLSHITVMPIIVDRKDAILLDHQVHTTVRIAVDMVKSYGIHVETIRHNNMEMLEKRYNELEKDYNKIWYLTDGVYSMFGDTIPVDKVKVLLKKLKKLYLYVDDAHGMSWTGEKGKGLFLSKTDYEEKMFLVTSLGKGFGAGGSAVVCHNQEIKDKIEILGTPLMFTSPVEPATLGAIIASAKIHLSDEITERQNRLKELIDYFYKSAKELDLPVVDFTPTPIVLMGTGKPDTALMFGENLFKNKIHVTGAIYPAVPYNNSGVRVIINLTQTKKDIDKILSVFKETYTDIYNNKGIDKESILKNFKLGNR